MEKKKVLFILKRRQDYHGINHSHYGLSTGLYNSANYMHEMLLNAGIESAIEVAVDNNCIDKFVTLHKPSHCIIEALWVVPSKFDVLTKLHPNVDWIIRLHSEAPFIAMEGIAMEWLHDYMLYPRMFIGVNAPRMMREVQQYLKSSLDWSYDPAKIIYLPNYYPSTQNPDKKYDFQKKKELNISCFGSIRPLKNHLTQALAAIEFCNLVGKKLNFHINGNRIEQKAEPILKNVESMFVKIAEKGLKHELVMHDWMPRENFVQVCGSMDIALQASFSETFNIVSADHVMQGVPLVGSKEIPWLSTISMSDPTNSQSIVNALGRAYLLPNVNAYLNRANLENYSKDSEKLWVKYFS